MLASRGIWVKNGHSRHGHISNVGPGSGANNWPAGDAPIQKRAIFLRALVPLLEFGRERQEIDLSKVTLTHHNIRSQGQRPLPLEKPKLSGLEETGTGEVRDKEKALLAEIIAKVNDLFEGDLTNDDRLVYVNNVLKGKLLESETLVEQAANNIKEQFANSPDLSTELLRAIMEALAAHSTMSQALNSERVREGLKVAARSSAALRGVAGAVEQAIVWAR